LVLVAIAVFAVLIYPGELSHISSSLNRRLYDRAAANYERKWASEAYRDVETRTALQSFCIDAIVTSHVERVLDLGCGTGRAVRLLADELPATTQFEAIDFSGAMLERFREWLAGQDQALRDRVKIKERNLSEWADDSPGSGQAGVVLLLEVGEFLSDFESVIKAIASIVAPGGGLLMTRPARMWWMLFAHRHQSRRGLERLLAQVGFGEVSFRPWRSRYELVFARKGAGDNSLQV
jgi:SAM-dependent methyltransferase